MSKYLIINGTTNDGAKFRPSDWCERLYGVLRALDEEEEQACRDLIHQVRSKTGKHIIISTELEQVNEKAYNFFIKFAKTNNLNTIFSDDYHKDIY